MTILKTSFARAAMLLLLAVYTTTTARATDYITDIVVLGDKDDVSGICATYRNQGYTIVLYDLNEGINSAPAIYLGYKTTSNPTYGSVITDFYIRGASSNISSPLQTIDSNGRTYHLAPYDGDNTFTQKYGDLNCGAGGDYIHLFYTKDHFDDWRVVTGITFNNTQSGAVGKNGGSTGYDLNSGAGGNYIYMHFTTARGPIFLQDVTSNFTAQNGDVLTGTLGGNYKISIANGVTITLNGVTINGENNNNYLWAGITCLGNATIVLEEGTTNTVKGFFETHPGIYIPSGKTLTIKGSGSLTAYSNGMGAGIGGGNNAGGDCGNIVIENGTITATGGQYSAGIGGVRSFSCGNITINGGTITANGGAYCAGIGSGQSATCGNITISGGSVNAIGGSGAAGIGSGYSNSSCGNINITTGVTSVTATKGTYTNNSIGAGDRSTCGTVTIGGVVTGNISQSPFVTYPYRVTFNANGGTGTMTSQMMMYNVSHKLSNNTFTKSNGAFINWNTQANGSGTAYANEQSVSNLTSTQGGTVTLFVQWQGSALADGTAYKATQDGSVATATYTKTLGSERVGKFQAWFLPFDYTITSADTDKFKFYKINMIANSPTPSQDATDEIWVFLKPIDAGTTLHANMPYVFKPKEAVTNYTFTSSNVTLKAKNTGVIAKTETMEDIYEFYGTYENTKPSSSDPFYYININGGISLGNSNSVTVGPYRWIIRKTSKYGDTTSYAPAMRFFDDEEDDDPTSIDNGQLTIDNEEESIYDLSGRKVNGQWSTVNGQLPKGIYIRNGRKVAVK